MHPKRGPLLVVGVLMAVMVLAVPAQAPATLLWGHPYAMFYEADPVSANFNDGYVFMWNATNPGSPYVGTAIIQQVAPLAAPVTTFNEGTWNSLLQGLLNKKLTYVWTDNGPDTNINDATTGNLTAFAVTIFGSP